MSGPFGRQFRNGRSGPLGRSRVKSANTAESRTGYRSRGPSALRQARWVARRDAKIVAEFKALQVSDQTLYHRTQLR